MASLIELCRQHALRRTEPAWPEYDIDLAIRLIGLVQSNL
jgi:hypothetical protein